MPVLRTKLVASLERRFPAEQRARILELYDDPARLDRMPVHEFVDRFVPAGVTS
jgi:2-methylcitrate dehydratase